MTVSHHGCEHARHCNTPIGCNTGTYVLTSVFNIRKPIVLRGAGKGKTILRFPKSLTDLYGNNYNEGGQKGTSQYSHGTGFINFGGGCGSAFVGPALYVQFVGSALYSS